MSKSDKPEWVGRLNKSIDNLRPLILDSLDHLAKKRIRKAKKQVEYWQIFSSEEKQLLKGLNEEGKERAVENIKENLRQHGTPGTTYEVVEYPYYGVPGTSIRGKTKEELLTTEEVKRVQQFLAMLTSKSKKKVLKAFLKKGKVTITVKDGEVNQEEEEEKKPKPKLEPEEVEKIKRVLASLTAEEKKQLIHLFLGIREQEEEPKEKEPVLDEEDKEKLGKIPKLLPMVKR